MDGFMEIVAAIDSFKGSMTSVQAGKAAAKGIHKVDPEAKVHVRPLADGGEGTVEALVSGMNGTIRKVSVTGPIGKTVVCEYGVIENTDGKTGEKTERSERKMKFGDDWKFKLVNKYNINDTSVQADGMDYDDSSWDTVDLPHDWAIYGTYENSNGVRAAQGSLAGGVGWYRKSFTLSDDFKDMWTSRLI